MNIIMLDDRVLLKPVKPETKRNSGLFVPVDTTKETIFKATVIAVGPGKERPLKVKEGDTVLYSKFAGSEVTLEEQEYLMVRESDIYSII